MNDPISSRREFLQYAGGAAAVATLPGGLFALPQDREIKLALIGCGSRGTGAGDNALSTKGPVRMVAMADAFRDRLKMSYRILSKDHAGKVDVPPERRFTGLDAFRKAIDAVGEGGVVLLATPPAFRPMQVEYAVAKGCHVFMEKSFAVDGPGLRRLLKANEEAKKRNLKIAGGLMCRHSKPLQEAIRQIHDGAIGEIVTCWAYREHDPVGVNARKPGWSELEYQIRNYSCFTWLNGSFLLDWLIHNMDVCCWAKNAWPVEAQGQGGRQVRSTPDQLFDHYAMEYRFADGTRMFAQGRHMSKCWNFFGSVIHGTKGSALIGEGAWAPRLYKGWKQTTENVIWEYKGPEGNHYQEEIDLLFDAIRRDQPYSETERCVQATAVGVLGRMAVESGKMVKMEQVMGSEDELAPGLDALTLEGEAPVKPDAAGAYPVARPGTGPAVMK